jgi:hypothetical protein
MTHAVYLGSFPWIGVESYSQESYFVCHDRNFFQYWLKRKICCINNCNSGLFKCMSLWRRGIMLSFHAAGPVSIPGADAESYIFGKRIVQCGRQSREI